MWGRRWDIKKYRGVAKGLRLQVCLRIGTRISEVDSDGKGGREKKTEE